MCNEMYFSLLALLSLLQLVLAGLPTRSPGCEEVEERVSDADKNSVVLYPPNLQGKWLSDRCENRPGPEYLLRSHVYTENDTFTAVLHKYWDPSCSMPWYTSLSRGRFEINGRSWLAPASAQAVFVTESVVLVAHSQKGADELYFLLNDTCPGLTRRWWRPQNEYTVFTSREAANLVEHSTRDWWIGTLDCLKPLRLAHELISFLRIQVRPPGPPDMVARTELMLGEGTARGTKLHTPLLYLSQTTPACLVCSAVDRSTLRDPPVLPAPTHLHMAGEWVSTRCEPRPTGLYLKRRLRVSGRSWEADYKFYSDPSCSGPTLTASAGGWMSEVRSRPRRLTGVADFDFKVTRAWLLIQDEAMLATLGKDCGPTKLGKWKVGERRELTNSAGCPALGISVPTTEYELVRLELDSSGQALLYLGQSGERKVRPTAFQPPLLQCDGPELPPLTHFLNSMNSAGRTTATFLVLLVAVLLF